MHQVSAGETHHQIYLAEDKHSGNKSSVAVLTAAASSSRAALARSKSKGSAAAPAPWRCSGPAGRCWREAETQPDYQNENHPVKLNPTSSNRSYIGEIVSFLSRPKIIGHLSKHWDSPVKGREQKGWFMAWLLQHGWGTLPGCHTAQLRRVAAISKCSSYISCD